MSRGRLAASGDDTDQAGCRCRYNRGAVAGRGGGHTCRQEDPRDRRSRRLVRTALTRGHQGRAQGRRDGSGWAQGHEVRSRRRFPRVQRDRETPLPARLPKPQRQQQPRVLSSQESRRLRVGHIQEPHAQGHGRLEESECICPLRPGPGCSRARCGGAQPHRRGMDVGRRRGRPRRPLLSRARGRPERRRPRAPSQGLRGGQLA